ncbi:ABC-ATPase domain-containing protein [Oceanobacillus kimchii]|uniref:ATPase n=1 Tax=Oceanobacillus kimchii TaxID=746691 RepID=A0ABQ5THN4_9BACI|nr:MULTISPECIES: ABC-ATPase domain-containing protein [Oceanobacillus]MCT1578594.1 ABC-ATPase domain-containing protein [Oceanobacillus kimchii]MCT2136357.1 ABC-ATPase domain-containing protein [Oceanobacillus kimchii]OEH54233.1 ATPase [Oceanobacillus sp. E9]GLO65535.1 ATPase [Oceanobacillus kimchii]
MEQLQEKLTQIDRRGYKSYKQIQGMYTHPSFKLYIDYVQGDPFASPSKIRLIVDHNKRSIEPSWLETEERKTAVEDTFARVIDQAISENKISIKGSGKSGLIVFDGPGQEILKRSAVSLQEHFITICLSVGLPAQGRSINGRQAIKLFSEVLPNLLNESVFKVKNEQIEKAIILADQQSHILNVMKENKWVSFVANGSILPRRSGVSNLPQQQAVPFQSPKENEVEIDLPHGKTIKGMATRQGVTLITGGGYHGKSTLLQAIERGVYRHTAGDGREFVLTDPTAVKIRAEDGRRISAVDISPFISNLPHGKDTSNFSTDDASGSTSQAANVMEALEVGAKTLLIDEDTSATNFMIRDIRMQKLVAKNKEPITPFIHRIRQLVDELGVSVILVTGGSGDYFSVADNVILMEEYIPRQVTREAKKIISENPIENEKVPSTEYGKHTKRKLLQSSFPKQSDKRFKIQAKGQYQIMLGKSPILFSNTEQLIDSSQTRMIAEIIQYLYRTNVMESRSFTDVLDIIENEMNKGLDQLTLNRGKHPGDLAKPRRYEIAAVLNRMRTGKFVLNHI